MRIAKCRCSPEYEHYAHVHRSARNRVSPAGFGDLSRGAFYCRSRGPGAGRGDRLDDLSAFEPAAGARAGGIRRVHPDGTIDASRWRTLRSGQPAPRPGGRTGRHGPLARVRPRHFARGTTRVGFAAQRTRRRRLPGRRLSGAASARLSCRPATVVVGRGFWHQHYRVRALEVLGAVAGRAVRHRCCRHGEREHPLSARAVRVFPALRQAERISAAGPTGPRAAAG
jgi:hypothetical protein